MYSLTIDLMDFKRLLKEWYVQNARVLPWRETTDPYLIWVSEVILQQTKVVQGMAYYYRFTEVFPTVKHLARANEDEVLKLWQGLGYYSRARNMLASAKHIVNELNGQFPQTYNDLLKLKGVGEYSAGAIASFAFKQPVPAIDGNVYRIIARIFGVFDSPFTSSGKAVFRSMVEELMDFSAPDEFNQALLDFGALQCIPRNPNCNGCPFAAYCYAYINNVISVLPVKAKKGKVRNRFFSYLLIRDGYFTYIAKRNANDIWRSLYEFPLIESDMQLSVEELQKTNEWLSLFGDDVPTVLYVSSPVKHLLSHQVIWAQFIVVRILQPASALQDGYKKVLTASINRYSIPTLIDNFLAAEPAAKYFLNP